MSELEKLNYIIFNIIPKRKRKKILNILNKQNSIRKLDRNLWEVSSNSLINKSYNISYYIAKNCFICNCEGYIKAIAKIKNSEENNKNVLAQNFKCIHIFALISYLLMKNEKI